MCHNVPVSPWSCNQKALSQSCMLSQKPPPFSCLPDYLGKNNQAGAKSWANPLAINKSVSCLPDYLINTANLYCISEIKVKLNLLENLH